MPSGISRELVFAGQARIARPIKDQATAGFGKVLELARNSDLAFTNFENTISGRHGGFQLKTGYPVPPGPEVLDSLAWMGFKALSLANNHAFDLGVGGVLSTLEKAEACGFLHAGLGTDESAASAPGYLRTSSGNYALVATDAGASKDASRALDASGSSPARPGVNRLGAVRYLRLGMDDYRRLHRISAQAGHEIRRTARVRIGFDQELESGFDFFGLRIEPGKPEAGSLEAGSLEAGKVGTEPVPEEVWSLDPADVERQLHAIRIASENADFVIAYLHHHLWTPTLEQVPDWIKPFARACIDAGAHAFVSHGVPLVQGMEVYHRQPIFYGLGNFIFHSHRKTSYADPRLFQSVLASCRFGRDNKLSSADFTPVILGGQKALDDWSLARDVPEVVEEAHGNAVLEKFSELSAELGTRVRISEGRGHLSLDETI